MLKKVITGMVNVFFYGASFTGAELFWMAPLRIAVAILVALFIFIGIAFIVFPPFRIDFGRRFLGNDWCQ